MTWGFFFHCNKQKCNCSHYDEDSLRDEKVRYDLLKKDTVFNIRYGFRDKKSNLFYLTELRSDGNGMFSKTSIVSIEVLVEILKNNVEVPVLRVETSSPLFYETTSNRLTIECDEDQLDQSDCIPVIRKPISTRISPQALKSLVG